MMKLVTAGDNAIMLYLAEHSSAQVSAQVQAASSAIEAALGDLLIDIVPSYASVLVIFDPLRCDHFAARKKIRQAVNSNNHTIDESGSIVSLPVYYHPEAGEDLERLADDTELSVEQVIDLHCGLDYRVYAIGFAPGFAYLGEVDKRIAAPRLATPRARVPRGAVAIADRQTAVYPAASPGGWNLIGRCPTPMFDASATNTMPVSVGDTVRFTPIDRQEFLDLGGEL